jgi:hypothetical protein
VSNVVVDIAYMATVASTLVGVGILVGGVFFLVGMVRAFQAPKPAMKVERSEPADVFAAIYRAALESRPPPAADDAPLSLPVFARVTRPDGFRARARVAAKSANA